MTTQERLHLNSETDIVNARMAVREFARHCGFSLADQVCISMAASSLAYSLGLARENSSGGEMLIEKTTKPMHTGVRVHCIKNRGDDTDQNAASAGNSRLLVDQIEVKPLPENRIEIIVTKWNSV